MNTQGPLPTVDAGSILQEQSKRALQALLPPHEYIFRDERLDDYGIDGCIELVSDHKATNLRAQVQLKGRSNTIVNKNGSVSVQVSAANINYLLNGSCPLYILFRPESNELRFAFARDEWARIERDNKQWREQQWITIHFYRVLNSESLADLRRSIATEADVRRSVDERLNALRTGARHVVVIDAQSLDVTDSRQILDVLNQVGHDLTNSGLAAAVIERARMVPSSMLLATPRAALAVAYAHFHLAHYYDASAAIRQMLLANPELDADDRSLLDVLYLSSRRMLGELDERQYDRELQAWAAHAPEDLVLQYDVSRAWSNYNKTLAKAVVGTEHRAAIESVRTALRRARRLKHHAVLDHLELLELTLQDHEIEDAMLDARSVSGLAALGTGDAHSARERVRAAAESRGRWLTAVRRLIKKTYEAPSKTYCLALFLRNYAELAQEKQRQDAAWANGKQDHSSSTQLVLAAREAVSVARQLEDMDLELGAMHALANTLDTCNAEDEATSVAREALRIAELCGSATHARHLREFLGGAERAEARKRRILEVAGRSEEEAMRSAPDKQVQCMAEALISAYQLPTSRTPNVLYGLLCRRQLARERRDWCKHIMHAEWQPSSSVMLYADRPSIKVICAKFQISTLTRSPVVSQISRDFREKYCHDCGSREPDANAPESKPSGSNIQGRVGRNKAKAERRRRRLLGN